MEDQIFIKIVPLNDGQIPGLTLSFADGSVLPVVALTVESNMGDVTVVTARMIVDGKKLRIEAD